MTAITAVGTNVLASGSSSRGIAIVPGVVGALLCVATALWLVSGAKQPSTGLLVFAWSFAGLGALLVPWQVLDARGRRYVLTETSLMYRCGVVGSLEMELPYASIRAISVQQNPLQRLFGVGSVTVCAAGVGGGALMTSSVDAHRITLPSIRDFRAVGELLRRRMHEAIGS